MGCVLDLVRVLYSIKRGHGEKVGGIPRGKGKGKEDIQKRSGAFLIYGPTASRRPS